MPAPNSTQLTNIAERYITQGTKPGLIPTDVFTVLDVAYAIEEARSAHPFQPTEYTITALTEFLGGKLMEQIKIGYGEMDIYEADKAVRGILDRLAIYCRENPRTNG